jgi:division protein CdvB (Snf7/Vps24/ESCRT-III family)
MQFLRKAPTMREHVRQSDRDIRTSSRELVREKDHLAQEEERIKAEMKKAAREGNEAGARLFAKSLLRNREQAAKITRTRTQLSTIQARNHTMASSQKIAETMGGVAKVMGQMNASVSVQDTQKVMTDFQRQSQLMDMTDELISEGLDSALGDDFDSEVDDAVSQVLDEIGINLKHNLASAPVGNSKHSQRVQREHAVEPQHDLSARLARLKS